MIKQVKRGDIFWFDFGIAKGSEQGGVRPALIIQNDIGNRYSPTVIICPITSVIKKKALPTNVFLHDYEKYGLGRPSQVIAEQIKTVNKVQLGDYIGTIDDEIIDKVDEAIEISVNVGRAKISYERREIKEIKRKAEDIRELDSFIRMWFSKNSDIERIKEYMKDREILIKDLEYYSKINNVDYREYYSPVGGNEIRMVG